MSDEIPPTRVGLGPVETLQLSGLAPVLPDDEPVRIFTHLTDSDGQAAIEHRRPHQPCT